ncbi:MAG TPA: hypothetical protein GX506_09145 [Firmicutes bacterium]|nr:hypothetical protein [Bacillota bacterium]
MSKDRELSIKTQAKLLGLNRSSLYYKTIALRDAQVHLRTAIDAIRHGTLPPNLL